MEKYLYTYYYTKDNKPAIDTKIELTDNIKEVKLPYKSTYFVTIDNISVNEKAGEKPSTAKNKRIHEYAVGTQLSKLEVENEYGKDSQVAFEMLQKPNYGLCVNPTCDWYILLENEIKFANYRELKYCETLLFAEIHFHDGTKASAKCRRPDISYVEIPQQKPVSYVKFYEIYNDSKFINGKEVEFYSKPVYLDKKYLVGEKIAFEDIDPNKLPASTYIDLKNTHLAAPQTTFCKTKSEVTTLSEGEILISKNKLHYAQNLHE